jgi:hypothetical protein
MAVRPPADAIVALRSMGRRWRGLFAGLIEDESPDALAHRVGSTGHAALDHVVAATRGFTFLGRALEQTLTEDDPVLHPAVADPTAREWGDPGGTVEERLAELAWEADALADRARKVTAEEWALQARVADHDANVSTLALLWDAVDSAVTHLKAAEHVLAEVRGRP